MMETWATVTLVLGASAISSLLTFFITKMQVRHSDARLEKQLQSAREMDSRQRKREVRGEPLLKLRAELARMADKQDKLIATLTQGIRFDITEAEKDQDLHKTLDNLRLYLASGDFQQTLFMQDDKELVNKAEEILRDYDNSYVNLNFDLNYGELEVKEREESMKVLERNKTRIMEAQSLINKRLEEL